MTPLTSFGPSFLYSEYKYLVTPRAVPVVRLLLESQLGPRPAFADGVVRSVYYDTIDRRLLGQCKDGAAHKRKFRVRRYDDLDWIQLQVKLKRGFAVAKLKCSTTLARPPGSWPGAAPELPGAVAMNALSAATGPLRPVVEIRYRRERFRARDFRVTLDTAIVGEPRDGLTGALLSRVAPGVAVLEIKTPSPTPTLPPGISQLVQFSAFSKYAIVMRTLLGETDVLCMPQLH